MVYEGFFYVESKGFEVLFESGNGSIHLAERSIGVYRPVLLGKTSMGWLLNTVKKLSIGEFLREFCRNFRVGSIAYVAQRRVNSHGRFLELSK